MRLAQRISTLAMAACGCALALAGCTGDAADLSTGEASTEAEDGAELGSTVEVIETLNRDPSFTQGLELLEDGTMVHSRGGYGESGIDILSPSGEVLRSRELPDDEFGEGVTVVRDGDRDGDFTDGSPGLTAYQLTWKSGVVHTWSVPDLVEGPSLQIEGEGWGLCYDDSREALWQSDGSATLRLLSVGSLEVQESVEVTEDGVPVTQLNELDCAGGGVWANIWKSNDIVAIEPETGEVTDRVDLSGVVQTEGADGPQDVLNGLASNNSEGTMMVTGKNWDHLYRVTLGQD
ncbi:glutaminyl-peptide cyclotransferase [soil metagenome]